VLVDYILQANVFSSNFLEGPGLKRFHPGFAVALPAVLLSIAFLFTATTNVRTQHKGEHEKKHGLSVKQYEDFHSVLHPLEHDALPKKDFRRIRAQSSLLVKRGKTLVKLGVPQGTSEEHKKDFAQGLIKFNQALAKFKSDARKGTDEQLTASYSAVHDSFEMLAAMLPRG
jgi:hypothetical protein